MARHCHWLVCRLWWCPLWVCSHTRDPQTTITCIVVTNIHVAMTLALLGVSLLCPIGKICFRQVTETQSITWTLLHRSLPLSSPFCLLEPSLALWVPLPLPIGLDGAWALFCHRLCLFSVSSYRPQPSAFLFFWLADSLLGWELVSYRQPVSQLDNSVQR